MIDRHNYVTDDTENVESAQERVHYFELRKEEDPFPNNSRLIHADAAQQDEVVEKMKDMVEWAAAARLEGPLLEMLDTMIWKNRNVFRADVSLEPPATFDPLKIELVADTKSVRVCLRDYTQEQRTLLTKQLATLVDCHMAYPSPTPPLVSASLLKPKKGSTKFHFTTDFRPDNRLTVAYQHPMPSTEQ